MCQFCNKSVVFFLNGTDMSEFSLLIKIQTITFQWNKIRFVITIMCMASDGFAYTYTICQQNTLQVVDGRAVRILLLSYWISAHSFWFWFAIIFVKVTTVHKWIYKKVIHQFYRGQKRAADMRFFKVSKIFGATSHRYGIIARMSDKRYMMMWWRGWPLNTF